MRAYLKYLISHKWYVFIECCKLGIPWLGFIHDWSKFLPDEFLSYARFFGRTTGSQAKVGRFEQDESFNLSVLLHHRRNRHHWQWWVLLKGDGDVVALAMPRRYRLEMLADWRGAARASRNLGEKEWYHRYGDKIQLHPDTRRQIEAHYSEHESLRL